MLENEKDKIILESASERLQQQKFNKFSEYTLINDLVLPHSKVLSLLRVPTCDVSPTHPFFSKIIDWFEYLEKILRITNGVGLASIQMNLPIRCFVFVRENGSVQRVMNPQIRKKSEKIVRFKEGCLSFPFLSLWIDRHAEIEVTYQVPFDGGVEVVSETLRGRDAVVFQHEYDHLDGILILDKSANLSLKIALERRNKIFDKIRRGTVDLSSLSPIY
jgi:peptide deformylase